MPPPAGQLLEAELAAADGEERVYPRVLDLSAMVGLQEFDELHRHLAECPTRRASHATSDPSNTRRVLGLRGVRLEVVSNFLAAAAARSRPFNTMVRVMGDMFGGAFQRLGAGPPTAACTHAASQPKSSWVNSWWPSGCRTSRSSAAPALA